MTPECPVLESDAVLEVHVPEWKTTTDGGRTIHWCIVCRIAHVDHDPPPGRQHVRYVG